MLSLDDKERRDLLDTYVFQEPTIKVNGGTFHVHLLDVPAHIIFAALNTRMQWIEGASILPRSVLKRAHSGLAVAWLVTVAYNRLEESVELGNVRLSLQDLAREYPPSK